MALRVLLADESPSIKKVFQLSLQDFGVELRTVNAGIDAREVAQQFHPDIVFADVLLPKKSGYDVCLELKGHPPTQNIPVVLMWSGFMELDRERFRQCAADADLEKPFDVESLRGLIKSLVPKTQSNPLTGFISMPTNLPKEGANLSAPQSAPPAPTQTAAAGSKLPPFAQPPPMAAGALETATPTEPPSATVIQFWNSNTGEIRSTGDKSSSETAANDSGWNMESFDELPAPMETAVPTMGDELEEIPSDLSYQKGTPASPFDHFPINDDTEDVIEDDFKPVQLQDLQRPKQTTPAPKADSWPQKKVDEFRVQVPDDFPMENLDSPLPKLGNERTEFDAPEDIVIGMDDDPDLMIAPAPEVRATSSSATSPAKNVSRGSENLLAGFDSGQIQNLIKEQARALIQPMIRDLILEVAGDIIRDEIKKILDDTESEDIAPNI